MAYQGVEEISQLGAEGAADGVGKRVQLGEGQGKSVGDPDVAAAQLLEQLHVVIARNAKGRAVADHVSDQAQSIENAGTAIDEISHEDGFPSLRVGVDRA